jgi:hypothetical protein
MISLFGLLFNNNQEYFTKVSTTLTPKFKPAASSRLQDLAVRNPEAPNCLIKIARTKP